MVRHVGNIGTLILLALASHGAHAGRSVVIRDESTNQRVIAEARSSRDGTVRIVFYHCAVDVTSTIDQLDLPSCQPLHLGREFPIPALKLATSERAFDKTINLFVSHYSPSSSFIGTAEGYGLASSATWLVDAIERAANGETDETPSLVVDSQRTANSFTEVIANLNAFLSRIR